MAGASRSFDDDELVGLFELSHDAFCIAGFDGYLRRANPAFARSLGYTLEELLARPFMDNVYPDDVESVEASNPERFKMMDIREYPRSVMPDALCCWARISRQRSTTSELALDSRHVTEPSERVVRVPHRLHMSPKGLVAAF